MLLDGAVSELVGPGSSPAASAGGAGKDAVVAVANTWADHFNVNPDERDEFIARYVRRVREHRFWVCSGDIGGQRYTACRLGSLPLRWSDRSISPIDWHQVLIQK